MEALNFINKNKKLKYEDIKLILENRHNLEIRLDRSNDYYMISTTNKSNFNDNLVRQCTGIMIEKDTNKILHYFGDKTYDIKNIYNNNTIKIENIKISNCLVSPYMNGNVIKVFNCKGKWRFATSKHTNIKVFYLNNKNITLYKMFEESILKIFDSINDFTNTLDILYCYSFILEKNNISMINKVCLNKLEVYYNFNMFKPLLDIKYNFKKYLIIEKIDEKVIKKIHASINDIKYIIHKNNLCIHNNKCFNKSCKLNHLIKYKVEDN